MYKSPLLEYFSSCYQSLLCCYNYWYCCTTLIKNTTKQQIFSIPGGYKKMRLGLCINIFICDNATRKRLCSCLVKALEKRPLKLHFLI